MLTSIAINKRNSMNLDELSDEKISEIIALAWCDKTTFEQIKLQTNINQDQVKRLMKKHLNRLYTLAQTCD